MWDLFDIVMRVDVDYVHMERKGSIRTHVMHPAKRTNGTDLK